MEIQQLDEELIRKEKLKKVQRTKGILSFHDFCKGWDACIRFVKKVEKAEAICIQCGKLLNEGEVVYDQGYEPFCKKCFEKVFGDEKDSE